MKFIARVPPGRLTRLDAEYYEPAALAVDSLVRSRKYKLLGDCIQEGYRVVYHGIDEVVDGASIPFLAPSDIDENGDYDVCQIATNVPVQYLARYPKGLPKANEILIEVKGNTAKVALVQEKDAKAFMVSGSLYKAQVKADTDPRFMASYLSCKHGSRLKRRVISNVNISYIGKDDLYDLPTPAPFIDAQHYVGLKVRQAEGLREWARGVEARFRSYVGLQVREAFHQARQSRVSSQDLDLDLNPGRFTPDRLEVRRALEMNNARRLEEVASIVTENMDAPLPNSRYLGLDGISGSSIDVAYQGLSEADVSGAFRYLPRGAAISKLRPYLNKAVFIDGGHGPVVGSAELLCVQSDQVHPAYLYGVLKLDTTLRQLNPVASGATHPRISPEDVLDLFVPWSDEHQRLGISLEKAQQAYFAARRLISAARQLVEALIEGKVSESELIAAGKDPDADCALLARLRDDGLDGDGSRLFPDIEALFELIKQVRGAEVDS
jgi:type I restriction enzyme, S subunit